MHFQFPWRDVPLFSMPLISFHMSKSLPILFCYLTYARLMETLVNLRLIKSVKMLSIQATRSILRILLLIGALSAEYTYVYFCWDLRVIKGFIAHSRLQLELLECNTVLWHLCIFEVYLYTDFNFITNLCTKAISFHINERVHAVLNYMEIKWKTVQSLEPINAIIAASSE